MTQLLHQLGTDVHLLGTTIKINWALQPLLNTSQAPCLANTTEDPAPNPLYNTQQQSPTPAPGGQRQILL